MIPFYTGVNIYDTSTHDDYTSYHNIVVSSTKYKDLNECIRKEDFDTLKKVFEEYGNIACSPTLTTTAAEINRLDILKFLIEHGCCWDSKVLLNATKHNNIDMIYYCITTPGFQHDSTVVIPQCPWNPECINYLAKYNNVDYLIIMYHIYHDKLIDNREQFWNLDSISGCNNLSFLKFYLEHNHDWNYHDMTYFIKENNLEAIKLFYEYYQKQKNIPLIEDDFVPNFGVRLRRRSRLKWGDLLLDEALKYRKFDIFRYLITVGLKDQTESLQYLNNNSYQIYKYISNKINKQDIIFEPETSSKWWIDFISSLDKSELYEDCFYSLIELYDDTITSLQKQYSLIEYQNDISKDIIIHCINEYL